MCPFLLSPPSSPEVPLSWFCVVIPFLYSVSYLSVYIFLNNTLFTLKKWIVTKLTELGKSSITIVRWSFQEKGWLVWHQVHWVSRAAIQAVGKQCHELVLGSMGPSWSGIWHVRSADLWSHGKSAAFFFGGVVYALCGLLLALRSGAKQNTPRKWNECSQLNQSKAMWGEKVHQDKSDMSENLE